MNPDALRRPFFVAALLLSVLLLGIELSAPWVSRLRSALTTATTRVAAVSALADDAGIDARRLARHAAAARAELGTTGRPPGHGIRSIALLDGVLVFTLALMGASLVVSQRILAKLQGCLTMISGLAVAVLALLWALKALAEVVLMVALLLAFPFGTIVYLAEYGDFATGEAAVVMGTVTTLRLAVAVCLVLAQQRFLRNTGLVLVILTGMLAGLVVGVAHGWVPGILVSITDGVAAIVIAVLAIVWAIVLIVGGLVSLARLVL